MKNLGFNFGKAQRNYWKNFQNNGYFNKIFQDTKTPYISRRKEVSEKVTQNLNQFRGKI